MNLFSCDYLCTGTGCGVRFNELVPRAERDLPRKCPDCGSDGHPTIGAPMVMGTALPDGTKRHDLRRLAEASRIEQDSFDLPVAERKHHEKAIADLTKSGAKK